jgi:hypothetical protein
MTLKTSKGLAIRYRRDFMPERTNLFQQVVAIIHSHMADNATVEESAMLLDAESGVDREVDVVITSSVAGHTVVVGVEATAKGRQADVKWVEGELAKHASLPTDKLVLVSEAGFSEAGKKKAEARGAVPLEPIDMTADDPVHEVVNRLKALWPKLLNLTPTGGVAVVCLPNGVEASVQMFPDTLIVTADGEELGNVFTEIRRRLDANFLDIAQQIGLGDITEDIERRFTMQMIGWEGQLSSESGKTKKMVACLEWKPNPDDQPEFHPIQKIDVVGKANIQVGEIPLVHQKLGDVAVSSGVGKVGNQDALLVVTENESGGKGTFRLADGTSSLRTATSYLMKGT